LVFRPIPWGISQKKYPTNSKYIAKYINLDPLLVIPGSDLVDFELKEDDHSRYNSFLATVSTGLINTEDNISLLQGTRFPLNQFPSIKRYGFRPMHVTVDSIVKNETLGNGSADAIQLSEANEILYDYWNNAVFAENGSVVKIGSNDVKLGKAVNFGNDVPYMTNKRYYLEGYSDTFVVDEKAGKAWIQDISLTRGFDETSLKKGSGFGSRQTEFTAPGEYTKRGK
jgi:hypothetical protein